MKTKAVAFFMAFALLLSFVSCVGESIDSSASETQAAVETCRETSFEITSAISEEETKTETETEHQTEETGMTKTLNGIPIEDYIIIYEKLDYASKLAMCRSQVRIRLGHRNTSTSCF